MAHSSSTDNIAARFVSQYGDADSVFPNAAHVVSVSIRHHRGGGHALEGRGALAIHDPDEGHTMLWSATQTPHQVKRNIIGIMGWNENEIDVIAPDVGGGFGPKAMFYPEEAVVPFCARKLGRPIKWIEDRREHFICASQERDQYWDVEAAFDENGKILGVRGTMIHDTGSYIPWGIVSPLIAATTVPGPYVLPNYHLETIVALTNKVHVTPVRGAGRPQAVFTMERLMDKAADAMGLDRAEIRRRNLIPADRMPYKVGLIFRDGKPIMYDSGDYPRCQAEALEKIGYDDFPARQQAAREDGRYLGIGMGNYVGGDRARAVRRRHGPDRAVGQDLFADRRGAAGPGTPHDHGATMRGKVRCRHRGHRGQSGRHHQNRPRRRHLCEPHRRQCRPVGSSRVHRGAG